jgi:putative protease
MLTDSGLYVWNKEAAEVVGTNFTLPLELNEKELRQRSFPGGEFILYGYLPLMTSAQCIRNNAEGCSGKEGMLLIKDRYGKQFTVKNFCQDCYNIIYNSCPLSLLHLAEDVKGISAEGYRISFTVEEADQQEKVLDFYESAFQKGEMIDLKHYLKDYTKGHFKRGVE